MIANYADHSANERTFLAWVRTVMAVVGFGLAAARIGAPAPATWSEVLLLATGGLATGGVVIGVAFLRMRRLRARINAATAMDDDTLPTDALLFLLVAALFALLAVFAVHVG